MSSSNNDIEFHWMPSHLGFTINELADAAADTMPIGPFPAPNDTIVSRLCSNKANVVIEWRTSWAAFVHTKDLVLKKKKKAMLPNAWDGKSKAFMSLAQDMPQFSRFIQLILGHAPTGKYWQHFFPEEPRGCTCFARFQTHKHLLMECPKYISKFSSIIAFQKAENDTTNIFKYLQKNISAFTFEDEPIDIYDPPWGGVSILLSFTSLFPIRSLTIVASLNSNLQVQFL